MKKYLTNRTLFLRLAYLIIPSLLLCKTSHSQDFQATGIGVQGNMYLSPVTSGKQYYGAYASVNLREESGFMEWKFITGLQFHEKVKIVDLGATLRFFPGKRLVYLGVSPYYARILSLKKNEGDEAPLAISKGYGVAHLGLQLPLGKTVNFEAEGNYNYFYDSKAAGYGFSVGLVFYSDDLVSAVSKGLGSYPKK